VTDHTLQAPGAELSAIAAKAFPGARVCKVERLTGGVSADVQRLDLELPAGTARQIVIRAHGRSHRGLAPAIEFQLLQALRKAGVPVPEPLLLDESRALLGDPYLLMAFVEGSTALPEETLDSRLATMGQALAAVHGRLPPGLPDLPARIDPLPELFDYLPAGDEWTSLAAHLESLEGTAYTGPPALLHGDFWPENLLWQNERLAAILDWEDAAIGDPLSDLAAARLELSYRFGREKVARFTAAYRGSNEPPDEQRLALWQIYVAAAAQHYMGEWGLPAAREAHMRRTALRSIREGAGTLMGTRRSGG
jgi:aminoglycoside phosphotransferase (APT) family kinase protein